MVYDIFILKLIMIVISGLIIVSETQIGGIAANYVTIWIKNSDRSPQPKAIGL